LVLILAIGGYFLWQYLQTQNTKPVAKTTTTTTSQTTAPVITDTATSVGSAVTDMQAQMAAIDDSEYQDSTMSDSSLLN
jgi:hypothetical protein